ncbi:hypothetical protein BAE44_0013744 [Dichanthelium oligosanthes]|uniref:Uncharacterized protein n=1 Tax=Dichanthelium oligosanthes TaxID=888268 RepID=A0A1E5VJE0_9POAL|nr:hypothetical protein BAE44_0013744 [Dichanthelium oligosanthes]
MPILTSDSIASPRWGVRSGAPRTRRPPSSGGQGHGCGWPLDRVAGWVGGGIAAVFFASLDRCSCVNVRTHDDLLDDKQRDSEAPLMFDDGNGHYSTARATGVERRRGGRRSGKSKRTGGGVCCYGDFVFGGRRSGDGNLLGSGGSGLKRSIHIGTGIKLRGTLVAIDKSYGGISAGGYGLDGMKSSSSAASSVADGGGGGCRVV